MQRAGYYWGPGIRMHRQAGITLGWQQVSTAVCAAATGATTAAGAAATRSQTTFRQTSGWAADELLHAAVPAQVSYMSYSLDSGSWVLLVRPLLAVQSTKIKPVLPGVWRGVQGPAEQQARQQRAHHEERHEGAGCAVGMHELNLQPAASMRGSLARHHFG